MKSHIQRHVNEGHDVTTAEDMVVALVVPLQPASSFSDKRAGVTTYMNSAYELEGVRVRKGYNIDEGNLHTYSSLLKGKELSSTNVTIGAYSQSTVRAGAISSQTTPVDIPCTEDGCSKLFRTRKTGVQNCGCGQTRV